MGRDTSLDTSPPPPGRLCHHSLSPFPLSPSQLAINQHHVWNHLLPLFQTLPHYSLHQESPPLFPLSSRKAIPHCRKYALAAIGK